MDVTEYLSVYGVELEFFLIAWTSDCEHVEVQAELKDDKDFHWAYFLTAKKHYIHNANGTKKLYMWVLQWVQNPKMGWGSELLSH